MPKAVGVPAQEQLLTRPETEEARSQTPVGSSGDGTSLMRPEETQCQDPDMGSYRRLHTGERVQRQQSGQENYNQQTPTHPCCPQPQKSNHSVPPALSGLPQVQQLPEAAPPATPDQSEKAKWAPQAQPWDPRSRGPLPAPGQQPRSGSASSPPNAGARADPATGTKRRKQPVQRALGRPISIRTRRCGRRFTPFRGHVSGASSPSETRGFYGKGPGGNRTTCRSCLRGGFAALNCPPLFIPQPPAASDPPSPGGAAQPFAGAKLESDRAAFAPGRASGPPRLSQASSPSSLWRRRKPPAASPLTTEARLGCPQPRALLRTLQAATPRPTPDLHSPCGACGASTLWRKDVSKLGGARPVSPPPQAGHGAPQGLSWDQPGPKGFIVESAGPRTQGEDVLVF
nr:nascent polypeptide-associated complex subunit alpha, muscle-specific form-like [Macaca fascicularis]